jgi:arabinose-5-phosphate isomerase
MDALEIDLELARRTLRTEGQAIAALAERIGQSFAEAVRCLYECPGKVILTGMGKAGIIARKISATLASTGTQSIFLHPAEAVHGDLGRVQRGDVVMALSHSGQTDEIVRLLDHIKARGATLIALTGSSDSPLARYADITIAYGQVEEACPLGLAPTVSTSVMLALGDALALTVMEMRCFRPEDFAAFHPGGELGRRLMTVEQVMMFRQGTNLCPIPETALLGDALAEAEKFPRRSGAMLLVNEQGRLSGILTDADLRRLLLAHRRTDVLERPVAQFMKRSPKCIRTGELASEALAIMNRYRIDELPVVDGDGRPVGIVDVQDLLGLRTMSDGPD